MKRRGFSLVELLVTIVIIITLSVVVLGTYSGKRSGAALSSMTQSIVTALREAQSRTIAGDQNGTSGAAGFWGVKLSNPTGTPAFYALFYATSTATTSLAAAPVVGSYRLSSYTAYLTSTIPSGGTLFIYYTSGLSAGSAPGASEACVGFTCAATSTYLISLYTPFQTAVMSSTITVNSAGEVSY